MEDKPTPRPPRPPTVERSQETIARTVQAMLHSTARAEPHAPEHETEHETEHATPTAPAAQTDAPTPGRPHAAWRALGDWRAVLAGTAVVCAAALFGPLEVGMIGLAAYRMFVRDPLAAALSDEEALAQLSESLLQRLGKSLMRSASRASVLIYAIEIGGVAYLGFRVIRRWRARRRGARRAQGAAR